MVFILNDRLTIRFAAIFLCAIDMPCLIDKATVRFSIALFNGFNQIETKTDANIKRALKICSE
jgi:hypothetical protein